MNSIAAFSRLIMSYDHTCFISLTYGRSAIGIRSECFLARSISEPLVQYSLPDLTASYGINNCAIVFQCTVYEVICRFERSKRALPDTGNCEQRAAIRFSGNYTNEFRIGLAYVVSNGVSTGIFFICQVDGVLSFPAYLS